MGRRRHNRRATWYRVTAVASSAAMLGVLGVIILVSAFAGREFILRAYRHAVAARYRFYSYGDCMFVTEPTHAEACATKNKANS